MPVAAHVFNKNPVLGSYHVDKKRGSRPLPGHGGPHRSTLR
jgi:hypothetical protein